MHVAEFDRLLLEVKSNVDARRPLAEKVTIWQLRPHMRLLIRDWTESIETLVLEVISGHRQDRKASLIRGVLYVLSLVFKVAIKCRRALYNLRLMRDATLGVQVIGRACE